MNLLELIRWGWANDREAFLIPLVLPGCLLALALTLEIISNG